MTEKKNDENKPKNDTNEDELNNNDYNNSESNDKKDIKDDDIVDNDIVDDDINDDDISDDDISNNDEPINDDDDTVYFKFNTTKHKLEGKHSLKRDTIFQGKIIDEDDEELYSSITGDYYNKDFPIKKGTMFEVESRNLEDLENQRNLKKDIYNLLNENTDLDFTSNRRKPNKQAFNGYYDMLLKKLNKKYTKSEIFVELSYYFTDHIFNMYKLLYPEHATNIIMELKEKGFLDELDDMKFI